MPTIEELKGLNDTQIRQQTEDDSVSQDVVANRLDAGLDFTNQQSLVKMVRVEITHDELLSLQTTPVLLVPSVSGEIHYPLRYTITYLNNTGWGSSGGPFLIKLGTTTVRSFPTQMGGSTIVQQTDLAMVSNVDSTESLSNKEISFTSTLNPSSPNDVNSSAVIHLTYLVITE